MVVHRKKARGPSRRSDPVSRCREGALGFVVMHLLLTPRRDGLVEVPGQFKNGTAQEIAFAPLFTARRAAEGFGHPASFTNIAAFDKAPEDVSRFLKVCCL